jgi:DnaK suppressor protein
MIVSLLQLMGFGLGKSLQSRADSDSGEARASQIRHADGVTKNGRVANSRRLSVPDPEHAQSAPSRRPEVKTKPASKAKTTATAKAPAPASRREVKGKSAPKAAPKGAAKSAAKSSVPSPVAKVATKGAVKAVTKAAAKTATKIATNVVPKGAVKAVGKAVARAAAVPAKKTTPQPAKSTAQSKSHSQTVTTKAVSSVKASATPVAPKAAAKPAVKTKAAPQLPAKPQKKEIPVLSNPITASKQIASKQEPEKTAIAVPTSATVPARSPRVSSRLAQLTVPSMASTPAVASTAAKASYGQATAPALPAPPHFVPVKKDPKLANNWKAKPVAQWTDEEVVAMPDAEYMNEGQMAFFRLKLMQLKRDILANAGETTEHLREETVVVPDPADRATIEEEHALELRTRDRERKLLKKIEQSIARIDAGDYGYCDETGEAIGVSRLLARPTATLSLEAQQRRELKQKMFGD